MNSGAAVINIVGLVIGVTNFMSSGSENIAAFSPLSPALQGLLNQWIHARVIYVSVAADCHGKPCKRIANLQGSEHHRMMVFVRAGTRDDVGLPEIALVAAAAAIPVCAEDALQIVLCNWSKRR